MTDQATYLPDSAATSAILSGQGRLRPGQESAMRWWKSFGVPGLDVLVDEAMSANPGLEAAQAALHQSSELVRAQWGAYLPDAQASFAASRQKDAIGTLSPTLSSGVPVFNLFTAQFAINYTLDIFGANRRLMESLRAQENYQRYQLEATNLTLQGNVVAAAIQLVSLQDQLAGTERQLAIQQEILNLVQRQHALGAISAADLAAQEALYSQTESLLPGLRRQYDLERDALAALLGRMPSNPPVVAGALAQFHLPDSIPLSVPSRLVEHRPDVRMAEEQMHSASAQVGVAIADMLPQLTLQADMGGTAPGVAHLFSNGNKFWSVGTNLSQVLFDGGALYFHKEAARAALDEAGAQYRASVLAAFQNVADALQGLHHDTQSLNSLTAAQSAADRSLEAATRAEQLGATGHLAQLMAQQLFEQAHLAQIQAQTSQYLDVVALYQALGGGWWQDAATISQR
jgi:NodT family efflux transporter outer membrane factor (OMF) lipoprotein